ncbi:MAG: hypothetical protein ACK4GU_16200 [Alishewanella aestuarii]
MKLVQWTLFIDMLGYRDINGDIDSEKKAEDFVSFMMENKKGLDFTNRQEVIEQYKKDQVFDLYMYYEVKHAFISDSLIITFSPKEVEKLKNEKLRYMHSANALFIILMRLQAIIFNCFSSKGIFLRGGISTKYCYIKDEFAVGEGLIAAYKAESSLAIYPRIVFSEEVLADQQLKSSIDTLSNLMYGGQNIIKRGDDGVYYLDYLGYNLSTIDLSLRMVLEWAMRDRTQFLSAVTHSRSFFDKHRQEIIKKLETLEAKKVGSNTDEVLRLDKVIEKFKWLKEYHNISLSKYEAFSEYLIS